MEFGIIGPRIVWKEVLNGLLRGTRKMGVSSRFVLFGVRKCTHLEMAVLESRSEDGREEARIMALALGSICETADHLLDFWGHFGGDPETHL